MARVRGSLVKKMKNADPDLILCRKFIKSTRNSACIQHGRAGNKSLFYLACFKGVLKKSIKDRAKDNIPEQKMRKTWRAK
ncbi:MAG: hypothetical protein R6X11_03845 [Desulfonatronovibrio sp.]